MSCLCDTPSNLIERMPHNFEDASIFGMHMVLPMQIYSALSDEDTLCVNDTNSADILIDATIYVRDETPIEPYGLDYASTNIHGHGDTIHTLIDGQICGALPCLAS